ncbi:hypothetical protein Pla123a_13990 [Posidoniimonas polymericola]|uniref:Uncharacterized protein n=1 Tax=Posidoniimonas polymericola TaxID=2528002 RepID=A0A5C5YS02_9BACT|nr:hypothetical protein [Posidoniimonas polymericola]TWT77603.1 hypothetical protein Pla123a_13990 [Posidoniimonas polymericola]
MPKTIALPSHRTAEQGQQRVRPSAVPPQPFTLDQELEVFGNWVSDPIWVPPKNASRAMADTILRETRPFTPHDKQWDAVFRSHRDQFTQVREIDLPRASIRLPKGRFFVEITEQKSFDQITDEIPACVQTRLDEFLAGPGRKRGVKVSYLKPLCVESCDHLILTTRDDLQRAIDKIQDEVFAEYRGIVAIGRTMQAAAAVGDALLAAPKAVINYARKRKQRVLDAYHARLEFQRRKTALRAARTYEKCRTDGCTFDEMLSLTCPLEREAVIRQYCIDQEVSHTTRDQLLSMAGGVPPWFVAFSFGGMMGGGFAAGLIPWVPPMLVCDPAFVAEMPDRPGELLKIGHFDEVDGVTHVEI